MSDQSLPQKHIILQLSQELLESSVVHQNVAQEFIITTEEKIKLCLIEYQDVLKAQTDWIAPMGVLIALLTTLVAADFRTFMGLNPEVWKALFIFASMASVVLLARALYRTIKLRNRGDIEYIVQKLKQGVTVVSSEK